MYFSNLYETWKLRSNLFTLFTWHESHDADLLVSYDADLFVSYDADLFVSYDADLFVSYDADLFVSYDTSISSLYLMVQVKYIMIKIFLYLMRLFYCVS